MCWISITQHFRLPPHKTVTMPNGAKNWCFTLNNPTDDHEQALGEAGEHEDVKYLVFGREQGESGTPHLQGYICFNKRYTFNKIKTLFACPHVHLEVAKGKPQQAADYCKKDGDFEEFGECPVVGQGKRTDIDAYVEWIKTVDPLPTEEEIAARHPGLWLKYQQRLLQLMLFMRPTQGLVGDNERPRNGWQRQLHDTLMDDPSDRTIEFIVDKEGNNGKTWLTRYFQTHYPEKTQVLRVGKRDDLAMAIDPTKSLFFFDVPRSQMEILQYSVLEMIKDRIVFSPKYHSTTKIMRYKCHVVVLCNEDPDFDKLSADRYSVTTVG